MLNWPNKDPQDATSYGIRGWKAHIGGGDKVASCTWSAAPEGLPLGASAVNDDGDTTAVRLGKGGQAGVVYTVTCHAVTVAGDEFDRSARIFVTDR